MKATLSLLKTSKAIQKVLLLSICGILHLCGTASGQTVNKQLYLSDPSQALDRVDPVATADASTSQTAALTPASQYLYALRGASRTDFWRYNISSNSWTAMSSAPGTISRGGALATNGTYIYAFRGNTTDFWRYDPTANSWSVMTSTPAAVASGGALVHVNGELYALRGGNTNIFWKYTIATNTWAAMANAPATVDWGGALTTDGTNIYALKGLNSTVFWKYTIATNTWSVMATLPLAVDAGASLSCDGTSIYALRGAGFNSFFKYSISANSWSALANTTNPVARGGSLTSDQLITYAMRGNAANNFWSFNGTAWNSLNNTPANVDSGGAIIKFGTVGKTTTFTQSPVLCATLKIKTGTITVTNYVNVVYGTMPANPNITATIRYGATNIITLTNPTYNSATNLLTWTGNLATDATVPMGQAISLDITTLQPDVSFVIEYDSQIKPSKIDFPVSTYINVSGLGVYNMIYPFGTASTSFMGGTTKYIRTTVTDPFGYADITDVTNTITPPGTSSSPTLVSSSGCTRVYQQAWTVPVPINTFDITSVAKEGYENTVTHSQNITVVNCITCPPTAAIDYATGNGGEPLDIDIFANDSDPNNDIDSTTLKVTVMPKNGDAIVDNNKITYLPNGTFAGNDTLTYMICDKTLKCATAKVIITINPVSFNTCADAGTDRTYYMPFAADESMAALNKSAATGYALPTTDLRTITSIKVSYPGIKLIWDNWEDGYESNILAPAQATTQVWGDGNIYNGIAPGYPNDILPPGASIVLDNTVPTTPRNPANIYYDGRDKLYSSAQIAVTQACGEPSKISVQCMKTNVTSYPSEFGQLFTIPVGEDLSSRDFQYTALFIRASQNNTNIQIDRDNDGDFETNFTLNEGQVMRVDDATAPAGTIMKAGAVVTSDKPIGIDAHFSGVDNYSSREIPVFPATWYSNTYYTPVPTTGIAVVSPPNPPATVADTAVVMLYNSLNRPIAINWSSGVPAGGSILLSANSSYRFVLDKSATAAYKFWNPTKESFVAIEIYDSYTPGGGGNDGATTDWAFNLISEARLTDFASIAWAPGSINGTRNDNPVWVTPTANTTVYVKFDGDILNGTNTSPCGLKYDISYPVNYLEYIKIKDAADNDQSGTAVYTCDGTKIAAVYGEDASTAVASNPSWDVGSTIQPFCKQKLVIANDDYAVTLANTPVTINSLKNDAGFLAIIDPATLSTTGLLQPKNGSIVIQNGAFVYMPKPGFMGIDTFQYNICSTPTPVVCATAYVYVTIATCPATNGQNIISGQVFLDKNQDGGNNDGATGFSPAKIYLYTDGNCDGNVGTNEINDSSMADANGYYQFIKSPEKIVSDNFDLTGGTSSCKNGSDGNTPWKSDWYDQNDPSSGFCVTTAQTADVEIVQDSVFSNALRLDDAGRYAIREFNMQNATQAYLSFSFRKGSSTFTSGENIYVQLSNNGSTYNTIYTIAGNGIYNTSYTSISNISINTGTYNTNNKTYLRFATSNNMDEGDNVFIDDVTLRFLQYDQCYIVSLLPSSLPSNASLNSTANRQVNFINSATCAANVDFAVKRVLTYAINDENSTWQGVNVSGVVKLNDFDQENNTQTFGSFLNQATKAVIANGAIVSGVNKAGTAVANAGTLTVNATGNYIFTPSPTFTGVVNVPYKICDNGSPSACDTAYLAITVDPLPAAGNSVIANNDEDISYGSAVSGNLFVNDRDPKKYSFTTTLFSYDTNGDGVPDMTTIPGTVTVAGIDPYGKPVANAGTLGIAVNGNYIFTPAANFTGSVDASYVISNTAGAPATANIHIEVLASINGTQNNPPFAGDDFDYTTINKPVTGSFITNDFDRNNDSLSLNGFIINTAIMGNNIGTAATIQGGVVQFYSNGTYTYTPPNGYIGPDYVTYSICDVTAAPPQPFCAGAIIHFLIAPGITISGKVWDDGDGNVIDAGASEPETNIGGTLYVNLVDGLGYVSAVVPVATDGTYSFTNIAAGSSYSLVLSTTQGVVGNPSPVPALPDGWDYTGETRNGTIDYGSMGIIDNRVFSFSNAVNYDFGIEQLPESDDYETSVPEPKVGQVFILNGGSNPPVLSGSDPEDCTLGCISAGRSVTIDAPPLNSNMYYNGVFVTAGQVITNFNPSLLTIEITPVTVGSVNTEFYYSFVDAAGKKDPVPARYSINWFTVLPATGLNLFAIRTGTSVSLDWKTISEINSNYFEIERSTDGRNYTKIGTNVKATGNSNAEKQYKSADDVMALSGEDAVYYRIKLLDVDGKIAYSNVAVVKLAANGNIKVTPNPFASQITISVSVEQNTQLGIRLMDISGRTVLNSSQKLSAGMPQVTLYNLANLTRGMYLVEVTDMETGKKKVMKVEKAN